MAPKPILYNLDLSAPVRTVKVIGANIGVEFEIRYLYLNTLRFYETKKLPVYVYVYCLT